MKESSDKNLRHKLYLIIDDIIKLKRLDVDNYYCSNLIAWFHEVVLKNISIYKSKKSETEMDQELYKKYRQNVYWIDFGRNIGSEFQDYHFAVVLYESKYTALVVPLTSKKEHTPKWIDESKNVIVDIGIIEGFPKDEKECYACTHMIQSVSKKRLSRYSDDQGNKHNIKISDEQMKKISDKVCQIAYNIVS